MLSYDLNDVTLAPAWQILITTYRLTVDQQALFKYYGQLLMQENEKYNLTSLVTVQQIVLDHFFDSLALSTLYDMKQVKNVVDVGSGAGFPGIPLAIMYPNITFILVEVNLKKASFLDLVVQKLRLTNIRVDTHDWRTFLKTVNTPVDIFVARASLPVDELLRIFKSSSNYKNAMLVYWASKKWIPNSVQKEYLNNCSTYIVGEKQRQLCFFTIQQAKVLLGKGNL